MASNYTSREVQIILECLDAYEIHYGLKYAMNKARKLLMKEKFPPRTVHALILKVKALKKKNYKEPQKKKEPPSGTTQLNAEETIANIEFNIKLKFSYSQTRQIIEKGVQTILDESIQ